MLKKEKKRRRKKEEEKKRSRRSWIKGKITRIEPINKNTKSHKKLHFWICRNHETSSSGQEKNKQKLNERSIFDHDIKEWMFIKKKEKNKNKKKWGGGWIESLDNVMY